MITKIGPINLKNAVFLAPMSGVTDAAFRAVAFEAGAGLVVSEMVASEELVRERPDMVRRAIGKNLSPYVIQLAGREAHWMAEGARVAQDLGADIIDINMGCPARQVTGGLSGSALMKDIDHATTLVEATVSASRVPVTLKMRLGWDDQQKNAPELARRAELSGVQLVTVHGRTRCQFYKGQADWKAIRNVRNAINIPLIANGDCQSGNDATEMMRLSGADGVMIGRAAYGRPWWPGVVARALADGTAPAVPSLSDELQMIQKLQELTLGLYGEKLGNKTFRKHLGWWVTRLQRASVIAADQLMTLRGKLLTSESNIEVRAGIQELVDLVTNVKQKAAA